MSLEEVKKLIINSPTKSCVLDPFPTFLIKECVDILLPSITKIINLSLSEGVFPSSFKHAIVTPLLKKSTLSRNELKNYRPVSGLCFLSKLLERAVATRMKFHLELNNLGEIFQSAYKSGHSTETALLCIKNHVHLAQSQGKATALILLDLSAAFDIIHHSSLCACLSKWFGFSGKALSWFRSYLTGRSQVVKVGESFSDPIDVTFGVPQGSVLGPILFSLYTVPLSKIISKYENIKFHFYADDTQLYFHLSPNSTREEFLSLQSCLLDIKNWMNSSKLKLNPDKTEFIVFGNDAQREKLSSCFPIDILGNDLHPSNKVKNLGVIFDSNFDFSPHVSSVCQKCFCGIKDLGRIRRFLTKDVAICVANALVSSRLDYCNSLFRSLSTRELHRLQCLQNSIARIVARSTKFSHITPVLRDLHWLPVKFRSMFKTATLVYKFLNTGQPKYFAPYLNLYSSTFSSRRSVPSKKFLSKPSFDTKIYKSKKDFNNSFAFDAPNLWNGLPDYVRVAPTLGTFRNKLKTYLFEIAFPP